MSTESTHRPCLNPMERSVPVTSNPQARCRAMEGALRAVADDGDHLAATDPLAFGDEAFQQRAPDAAAAPGRVDIDRILEREAVGGSRAVEARIGIARNLAVHLGHEVRKALLADRLVPASHLALVRRVGLEGREARSHVMAIDGGDRAQVARLRDAQRYTFARIHSSDSFHRVSRLRSEKKPKWPMRFSPTSAGSTWRRSTAAQR